MPIYIIALHMVHKTYLTEIIATYMIREFQTGRKFSLEAQWDEPLQ